MSKKKRAGKSSYTSKGIVGHPRRCGTFNPMERLLNQQAAWIKGKRVMLVVNSAGHKMEARQVWGLPPKERKKAPTTNG
tara:strand:- start:1130 stop:1366 length:237 start_codon:yes stop_codon:yes gene_type:complete